MSGIVSDWAREPERERPRLVVLRGEEAEAADLPEDEVETEWYDNGSGPGVLVRRPRKQ